ncbi:MAG: hypothetical protein CVV64_12040 [Candidatus Wallbacteria bacterium HGW-Wallbacteria-1]|jgi:chemotaxis signal transduction protein|uniref:CheW-like domain-containing protein n=1 Tax=Candidatus Wallbacteria bacterium HGW-Wallbacteria-1 TaxID=2013854 RepID=A0A2N1PNH3_9BACT|nr:MAG: hypothetical protein CVV64_12040 [Candidatus Wallbacteria bacterium HGW-Wallbacteria-1]
MNTERTLGLFCDETNFRSPGSDWGNERFIAFSLGGRKCYMELERVIEIVCMMKIDVSHAIPPYILGTLCLRGRYLPIADLPSLLGIPAILLDDDALDPCVIVAGMKVGRASMDIGVRADEIFGLVQISSIFDNYRSAVNRSVNCTENSELPVLVNLDQLLGNGGFLAARASEKGPLNSDDG